MRECRRRARGGSLFALMFLDEFDHWIKEEKGCEFYGRYMDDFYIIARRAKEIGAPFFFWMHRCCFTLLRMRASLVEL